MSYMKPVPGKDAESAPFWEACADHRLVIPQCESCDTFRFPPTSLCPRCHASGIRWTASPGEGQVFSWIVVRHPVPADTFRDAVPYVVALIELREGVRMVGNVVGCDVDEVTAGMPVAVEFRDVAEGLSLPAFRPKVAEGKGMPA